MTATIDRDAVRYLIRQISKGTVYICIYVYMRVYMRVYILRVLTVWHIWYSLVVAAKDKDRKTCLNFTAYYRQLLTRRSWGLEGLSDGCQSSQSSSLDGRLVERRRRRRR